MGRIKKILVPNKIPAGTSFKEDEIIINPIDGKAYIKKTDGTVIELGSGATTTGGGLLSVVVDRNDLTFTSADGSTTLITVETGSGGSGTFSGTTTNALSVDNATLELNTGTTFNGSAARTISIKDGGVDSDALAADIAVTTLTATHITASGDISSSEAIIANNITSSEALLGDLRIVGDKIQPSATDLTHLEIDASDARIQFNIAGSQFFKIDKGNPNSEFILGTTLLSSSFDFFTKGFSTTIPALRITSSGNVGIGTKNPDEKLEVIGNISASGTIVANKIESDRLISHAGDANTGLQFAPDTVNIESNDDIIAKFSSGKIILGNFETGFAGIQISGSIKITGSDPSSERTPLVVDGDGLVSIGNADYITRNSIATDISGAIDIATGSLIITASSSNTNTLQFTAGDNSTFDVVHTASLSEALTTVLNSDVGAVSNNETFAAGTSIESLLRQLLIDFIAPTLNSFTITSLDSRMEVGDDLTVTAGTFSTSSNSDTAFASLGLTLSNNFENTISNFEATSGTALDFDNRIISQSTAKSITFTLTGTDSQGNTPTRTDSISILNPIFYGGSSNTGAGLDVSLLNTIIGNISGSVSSTTGTSQIVVFNSDTGTFGTQTYLNTTSTTNLPSNTKIKLPSSVANASNFTYIIYPSSYGELASVLKNDVQDETGTFSLLGAVNHTRYKHAIEYNVYRSAGQNAFADGDVLTLND